MAGPSLSLAYRLLQAANARTLAGRMSDPCLQQQMLLIARRYEKLAKYAGRVARRNLPVEPSDVEGRRVLDARYANGNEPADLASALRIASLTDY
jgi:hypothetical protein